MSVPQQQPVPAQQTPFNGQQLLPALEGIANEHDQRSKKCCDCNCDCGQTLVNTFADIVTDKLQHIYEHINIQQKHMDRLEGQLERVCNQVNEVDQMVKSLVAIRYPELKRKTNTSGLELVPHELDDEEGDTPRKRKRIYSHDIGNKINTILEPLFEENWKLSKEREREVGQDLAKSINIELTEALNTVKAFWHRSRGNSKRLFTQLDDYRQGLELIMTFDPEKKREALNRYRLESEDVITTDLGELTRLLDDMKKKGSGRTAPKGKKSLKRLPDGPIKTVKGRATALCNHFSALVQSGGNMDVVAALEEYSPGPSPMSGISTPMGTPHPHLISIAQPLMASMLNPQLTTIPLTPT